MDEIDVTLGTSAIIPVDVPSTSASGQIVSGSARLYGWSFRESGGALPVDASATVVAPAATTVIATTGALAAGVYDVQWTVELQGAAAAGDANNFKLFNGAGAVMGSENAGAAGSYPQPSVRVTVAAGQAVSVQSIGAGTAGVGYTASISATPSPLFGFQAELRDNGQSLGCPAADLMESDTKWFGPPGVTVQGGIKLNLIAGTVAGVVYIASDSM